MSSNPHDEPHGGEASAALGGDAPSAAGAQHPHRTVASLLARYPLRHKLIAAFAIVLIGVSVAIAALTQVLLTHFLTEQLDTRVHATAARFAGPPFGPGHVSRAGREAQGAGPGAAATPGAPSPTTNPLCAIRTGAFEYGNRQPDDSVIAVVDPTGGNDGTAAGGNGSAADGSGSSAVLAAVRGSYPACETLTADQAAELATVPADGQIRPVRIAGFGDYRVIATAVGQVTIVTGLSMQSVEATGTRLVTILAVVVAAGVVVGGAIVWWIVRRSLRPLDRVAATARQVAELPLAHGDVDLAVRVPADLTDARTETGTVGAALNVMLTHIEGALVARQDSEARVRRFVADASHELRTPLTAIRGYAELAGRNPDDAPAVTHALARVQAESTRMSQLVEELLLLARLDSGRALARGPVDLTSLAAQAVSDARIAGTDHRWRLDLPAEPVVVTGDAPRLHQVLANLLANARVHTPAGTTVQVAVRRHADGSASVQVVDDGPGIPTAIRSEVFGRFVRGDDSRSRRAGSTGLGLAIVAGIVAAHQGTVTVDSSPGRTAFTVDLPA